MATVQPLRRSSFAWRLRATRTLVLVGMMLGYLSYGVYKLTGLPELYPFASWRLYSAPIQPERYATYRVYTQAAPGAPWVRHPIAPTEHFDRTRIALFLERMTGAALTDSSGLTDARERLGALAAYLAPGAWRYSVVAESFHPRALLDDPTAYDTSMVFRFDGLRARPRAAE